MPEAAQFIPYNVISALMTIETPAVAVRLTLTEPPLTEIWVTPSKLSRREYEGKRPLYRFTAIDATGVWTVTMYPDRSDQSGRTGTGEVTFTAHPAPRERSTSR